MYTIKVGELVKGQEPITIGAHKTVEEALDILNKHHILAAPVIDRNENKCLGFVDVLDIVAYLNHVLDNPVETVVSQQAESDSLETDDIYSVWIRNCRFSFQQVGKIIDLSRRNPFVYMRNDAPLAEAVKVFAEGVHRVVLVDTNLTITNVLTQSTLLKYIGKNPWLLGTMSEKTLMDLGFKKNTSVQTISKHKSALDALRLIHSLNLSAVAVTEDDGTLHSQISASDLRGMSSNLAMPVNLRSLLMPLTEFIPLIRRANHNKTSFLVWCMPGCPLVKLIDLMLSNNVHRVYALDNSTNVWDVISMTDIMRLLAVNLPPPEIHIKSREL